MTKPQAKYWRLTYRSKGRKVYTFFTVAEVLEHVRVLNISKFHLEDLTDTRVH